MSPHPVLIKWFVRFQIVTVVSLVVLGAFYALGLGINSDLLIRLLDPAVSIVANVVFFGLFMVPSVWIVGRFLFVTIFSRDVPVELRERLQRLAVETLRRMGIDPGSTRFAVRKRSGSATVRRSPHRDTIAVGEQLLRDASDGEIMAVLGHELGHIVKRHLTIRGALNTVYFFAFLGLTYEAGRSHAAALLSVAGLLGVFLAGVPLNWRIEYTADKFSADKLGPSSMVTALERMKMYYPDCVSLTHPPLSRRIRRIQSLSLTPLITHVYG